MSNSRHKMKKIFKKFDQDLQAKIILTLITALGIFLFSSIPGSESTGTQIKILPILYHFIAFTIFGFLLFSSIKQEPTKKHLFIAIAIATLYGILDEVHQIFVPLRDPTIKDVATDFIGILIGTTTYYKIKN